jgi:glycerol-3-phosphate acyltransferase PlsY
VEVEFVDFAIIIGLLLGGYLCGSIPFGLLVGFCKGVDIRTVGSKNIGATNVGRMVGRPYGLLVFVLDLLKGFLPAIFAGGLLQGIDVSSVWSEAGWLVNMFWVFTGAACILGHMFPVYLRFKGGKGVATSLGVLLGIYPYFTWPGLIAFCLWAVVLFFSRYVSLASVTAAVGFPIIFAIMAYFEGERWGGAGQLWPLYGFGIVLAVLVVYRHRSNIQRLVSGVEAKIGSSGGQ